MRIVGSKSFLEEEKSDHSKSENENCCSHVSHSSGSCSESARYLLLDTNDSEDDESDKEEEAEMKNATPTQIPQAENHSPPLLKDSTPNIGK
eukprot:9607629-Ditylum_brightwellii.AAC.1